MALIAMLLRVTLLTILLVAFLSAGAIEAKNAKVYTDGTRVDLLAQTAVNVVLAEVRDGTAEKYWDEDRDLVGLRHQPDG